ncbi:hypothetical protein AJ87_32045 [Rhizobium yanglingense]|nr:hypothetical protein AJ87_32045 [Rhizobium yanglingense]
MTGATDEAIAPELVLIVGEPLDLRAHGAVKNEDSFARGFPQSCKDFAAVAFCPFGAKRLSNTGGLLDVVLKTKATRSHKDIFMSIYA